MLQQCAQDATQEHKCFSEDVLNLTTHSREFYANSRHIIMVDVAPPTHHPDGYRPPPLPPVALGRRP